MISSYQQQSNSRWVLSLWEFRRVGAALKHYTIWSLLVLITRLCLTNNLLGSIKWNQSSQKPSTAAVFISGQWWMSQLHNITCANKSHAKGKSLVYTQVETMKHAASSLERWIKMSVSNAFRNKNFLNTALQLLTGWSLFFAPFCVNSRGWCVCKFHIYILKPVHQSHWVSRPHF